MNQRYRVTETSQKTRFLEIERPCPGKGSRWDSVGCPWAPHNADTIHCGDWCALFHEETTPDIEKNTVSLHCGKGRTIYVKPDPVADDS